jgi:hypothetical protein
LFNFSCIYIWNLYEILLFLTVASGLHAFVNAIRIFADEVKTKFGCVHFSSAILSMYFT